MYFCYKKHFNKEFVRTKKDDKNFERSAKCWICDNAFVENDVKVRDHCHVTGMVVLHRETVISTSF